MTVMIRLLLGILIAVACVATPVAAHAAQPPDQQEKYVPLNELPPGEQLDAAPLLIGAYSFVLVALFAYLFSLARRMTAVQREVERVEHDVKRTGRG